MRDALSGLERACHNPEPEVAKRMRNLPCRAHDSPSSLCTQHCAPDYRRRTRSPRRTRRCSQFPINNSGRRVWDEGPWIGVSAQKGNYVRGCDSSNLRNISAYSRRIASALSTQGWRANARAFCPKSLAYFLMILTDGGLTLSFSIPET